ncbi:hypothetical protein K502DRAFT_362263 [Neoconidiobolus thromboides FSU 785]|nr:hypothetical protein K502DRAFT_362263 [Neoconidiobolus thromboides FSU 785]
MKFIDSFLFVSFCVTNVFGANNCPEENLCFDVQTSGDEAKFTVEGPKELGWIAVGLGTGMEGSEIFITYFDDKNKPKVTHAKGTGHEPPKQVDSKDIKIDDKSSKIAGNKRMISFTRKLKKSFSEGLDINNKGSNDFIWAYHKNKPNSKGEITHHLKKGTFELDLASKSSTSDNGKASTSSSNDKSNTLSDSKSKSSSNSESTGKKDGSSSHSIVNFTLSSQLLFVAYFATLSLF